jgi:tripeptidyl-peptidase I
VGNGSLPLKFVPLKKNGTATNGPQPADVPSSCDSTITPACVEDLYGLPTTLATQSSNQIAVAGYSGQFAQQADLTVRPVISSAINLF